MINCSRYKVCYTQSTILYLIITVLLTLGVAFFATQNTATVPIFVANVPIPDVPVYMIVIISLLTGMVVAWLLSLLKSLSASMTIRNRDSALKESRKTITSLTKRVHVLEIENTELKSQLPDHAIDDKSL